MDKTKHSIIKRVAFIGNYLPHWRGIATFTTDLCEAIAEGYKGIARSNIGISKAWKKQRS